MMDNLIGAVRAGDEAAVAAVLGQGGTADERDQRGYTALMLACEGGYTSIAGLLLQAGASPNRSLGLHYSSGPRWWIGRACRRRPERTGKRHGKRR